MGDDQDDDDELRRRLLAGDESAWVTIVRRHYGAVRRFFLNKVNHLADELTQRTFDRLERAKGGYQGRGSVRSFIFGVANNILREFAREARRDAVLDLDDVTAEALDPRPSSLLVRKAEHRAMLRALRRLSLAHQVVLELSYWEGMTDREIGDALDISPHTVRGRLSRARERLREEIAAIETSGEPQHTTSDDIDGWVRRVRDELPDDDDESE